jgi:hypothetical protein
MDEGLTITLGRQIGLKPDESTMISIVLRLSTPVPIEKWHEDDGPALWWTLPVSEPPYVGSPLDDAWPGYHTHWTPILPPMLPDVS